MGQEVIHGEFSQMSGRRQEAQSFLPFYKIPRCSEEKMRFPSFRLKLIHQE
jgi:hypothetical protein